MTRWLLIPFPRLERRCRGGRVTEGNGVTDWHGDTRLNTRNSGHSQTPRLVIRSPLAGDVRERQGGQDSFRLMCLLVRSDWVWLTDKTERSKCRVVPWLTIKMISLCVFACLIPLTSDDIKKDNTGSHPSVLTPPSRYIVLAQREVHQLQRNTALW